MTNDDLERRLRSESGPREHGYMPSRLPNLPHEVPRRAMAIRRAAVLVPAVLAGLLVAVVAGSALRGDGTPRVGNSGDSSPSATGSTPALADCAADQVVLAAEPWGGAAGSRGTAISVRLVEASGPCRIPSYWEARLTDGSDEVVIQTGVGLRNLDDTILLQPDTSYAIGASWSNWCESRPTEPLSLAIRPPSFNSWIAVPIPADGADPVPPCLGTVDTALNLTELQLAN